MISEGNILNISPQLDSNQQKTLINVLQEQPGVVTWDCKDMHAIHPNTYTHHIYIQENAKRIRQPQRRMNPALKDIVKGKLQKLSSMPTSTLFLIVN